jgi:2-desacetyl-2-hydroxyethyl bacteriochlorophyllide A dehydrogenase
MRALVFHGRQRLELEEVAEPRPAAGEVLVQVAACGICGSDLHGYLGHSARRSAHVPLIMGHEFTGRIVEIGEGVNSSLAVGDRVIVQPQISCGRCRACRAGLGNICPNMAIIGIERPGAFAEVVAVPTDRVFGLPADLSDVDGALVETLAVEVHLFRHMTPPLLRTVVILGAGAQGLLAAQLAKLAGATQVIVTDRIAERLALAKRLGASITIEADQENLVQRILDSTDGWGADLVVDAVGAPITRQQAIAVLAPGGTLGLIGLGKGETTLDFLPVVNKELQIRGSYCYSDDDFQRALELLAARQIKVQDMIQVAPLAEGESYFQRLLGESTGLTKVLLRPT